MMGSHAEKTVRVIRVAVIGSKGDFAADKARLKAVSAQIQQVVNDFASHWLRLHYAAGNHLAVRKWIEADRAWIKTPKNERQGKRKPCEIKPCDAAMSREIYAALRVDHFSLGTKPMGLATQKAMKRLTQSSATKSAYPRWMIILSGQGEFPQSSRPMPVPFYTSNCKLCVPQEKADDWFLEVRLEQSEGDKRGLIPIVLKLKTGGYRCQGIREVLWKIASGEWKFCASDLVCKEGKWYAHICYQMPKANTKNLDASKTAFLTAGYDHPIGFRCSGRTTYYLRRGNDVSHVRRQLACIRRGKNESRKYASSARKGHGRNIAVAWREKLTRRWRDFVKTWNCQLAAEIAKRLVFANVGRLVVFQPAGDWRDTRFLAKAGKQGSNSDPTGWDWYQMQSQINRICEENGIAVVVKKVGERDFSEKKMPQKKAVKRVKKNAVERTAI